jgi:hypothetical protein
MAASDKKTLVGEMGAIALGAPILVFLVLGVETWVWSGITLWVGAATSVIFSIIIVNYALNPKELEKDIEKDLGKGELGDYYLFGIPYLHYWAAVLLFRGVWISFGGGAYQSAPDAPSLLDWMRFVLDHFLGVILFDAPDTFGFRISAIEPAAKLSWVSLLVFVSSSCWSSATRGSSFVTGPERFTV